MVNTNIIARISCPICGEPLQDLKVNKNGNLYCFCDNGCRVTLSGKMSRAYRPRLLAGENVSAGKIGIITSLNTKGMRTDETRTARNDNNTTAAANTAFVGSNPTAAASSAGNNIDRRTDRANTGVEQPTTGARRGLLAALLTDDDE